MRLVWVIIPLVFSIIISPSLVFSQQIEELSESNGIFSESNNFDNYARIIFGIVILSFMIGSILYKYYGRKSGKLEKESTELDHIYTKLVGGPYFRVMENTDLFVVIFYEDRLVFCREDSFGWFGNHPNRANFSSLKKMSSMKYLDKYKNLNNKNQLRQIPFEYILDADKKNYSILYSEIIRLTFCRDYANQVVHNLECKLWIDTQIKERELLYFLRFLYLNLKNYYKNMFLKK